MLPAMLPGRKLSILVVLTGAMGCASPLLHPLRATNGPYAEGALSFVMFTGRHGSCDNFEGCVDSDSGGGVLNFIPQLGAGYSHVAFGHLGMMAGAYFPAWENIKHGAFYSGIALTSFFTAQNEHFSVGAGPELGVGGVAVTVGGEVQPWGRELWRPRVGGYGRRFWSFSPNHEEFDNRGATSEVGGRLRVAMIYLGYDYYMQDEGAMYWTVFETASYAQGHHTISLGMSVDLDTVRAMNSRRE